ncbi:MAG: efflux RND transporter periplasmic adaptor subunit [Chloroflexota bacterium]
MSVRRSLFVLTLLTLTLPVAVFSLRANRPAAPLPNLQRYTVERGDVDVTISAVGKVDADRSANLSFALPGRITGILVEAGDAVAEGDVLAYQADDSQQIAHAQAQLSFQLAQLQKDQLLAGPDAAQIAVAQANIDSAQGAVSSILNSVSPDDLHAAELAYEQAQQAVEAAQHARSFGNGTEQQVDLLDAQVGEATFNAEVVRLNLESLQGANSGQLNAAYARVNQAQAELDRLMAGATDAQVSQADAAIAQAQVAVDRAQMAVSRTQLSAPFSGIVTSIDSEVGALVAPGVTVVQIADVQPLRLIVQVDEVDVQQIAVGSPATITLDALPDVQIAAALESIALVPNNVGGIVSYDAIMRLSGNEQGVRIGMTAEASVIVQSRQGVLVVPNAYIRLDRQRGGAFVNVVQADGRLLETPVTLGLQGQERSEITAGLYEGDVIAVDLSADRIGLFGS